MSHCEYEPRVEVRVLTHGVCMVCERYNERLLMIYDISYKRR